MRKNKQRDEIANVSYQLCSSLVSLRNNDASTFAGLVLTQVRIVMYYVVYILTLEPNATT